MLRYTYQDGTFVVHRNALPEQLLLMLSSAEKMSLNAKRTRRMADQWQGEGEPDYLVRSCRVLTAAFEAGRDLHLPELWTFYGDEAPGGLTFDLLRIED